MSADKVTTIIHLPHGPTLTGGYSINLERRILLLVLSYCATDLLKLYMCVCVLCSQFRDSVLYAKLLYRYLEILLASELLHARAPLYRMLNLLP